MGHRLLTTVAIALTLLAAAAATSGAGAQAGDTRDKVVYHMNEGLAQASSGLRNIRNHLEVNPDAVIEVVAHANGVDFLMKGAEDKNGNRYEDLVERLAFQDVKFKVCEITLRARRLSRDRFIDYVEFVPSGVAEVARLQQREGYAYLKP